MASSGPSGRPTALNTYTQDAADRQADLKRMMAGYGLSTIEIHYWMPDHPHLIQQFAFQQYDLAPRFPELRRFLDFWKRDIEAALHSVRFAHQHLIRPTEWRAIDGEIRLN